MSKDVIYVDIEDDITDIVSKVKSSDKPIVALVPPKRMGALQSVVNLKLLARMARTENKRVVVISSNPAFEPLAAVAGLPIAKSLQSRPVVPETEDDSETIDVTVIDGAKIPIGEYANGSVDEDEAIDDEVIDDVSLDDEMEEKLSEKKKPMSIDKKTKSVPDFGKFRKKILIIGSIVVLLGGFLVWAIVFAPAATVVVSTRTAKINFSESVKLVTDQKDVDIEQGILLARKFEIVKTSEVEFEPTGEKIVGEKATGEITLTRTDPTVWQIKVPIGTEFTGEDGKVFVSTEAATLEHLLTDKHIATVKVVAKNIGDEYNVSIQSYTSKVLGFTAKGTAMTGGSKETLVVVSQEDFDKAKDMLVSASESAGKKELFEKFDEDLFAIEASAVVEAREPVSIPAVGEEAKNPKAKMTAETAYSAYGIDKSQMREFLNLKLAKMIENEAGQKVYDNGFDKVFVDSYVNQASGMTGRLKTTAEVGPDISEEFVLEAVRGGRYGEIQRKLGSINGVRSVDVKFSYFWVTTVPKNDERITIKFDTDE